MKNIFDQQVANEVIDRLNKLTPETKGLWGTMNPAQMFAHCNVAYEMAFDNTHKKPNAFVRFMLKLFVKETVVGSKPYKKNNQTAPAFVVKGSRDFDKEKQRLIDYINKTVQLGQAHFDGKESLSFGKLSIEQWNNLFYKHLDHHLMQFGA